MNQKNVEAAVQGELFKRRRSQIPDAERVLTLQEKLYQKAKQERGYKFYFHLLDRIVNNAGSLFWKNGVKIVRYADDFVLMGRSLPVEMK